MEALVLQQEIAEELERERKRNQKELSSLQHTTTSLTRQRDEAQRVVLHLRSLIGGHTHQMDNIARSIGSSAELSELVEKEAAEEGKDGEPDVSDAESSKVSAPRANGDREAKDVTSDMSPELERHLLNLGKGQKQLARLSITDVADRYLRDKTDSISDIIRGISDQCAAAVEGLHLAQDAEGYESEGTGKAGQKTNRPASEYDGQDGRSTREGSETGDDNSLHPDNRTSSVPPTPDLVHNRSSTSMSNFSNSTYPERSSQQYAPGELPTRIVEDDDEQAHETDGLDDQTETGTLSKQASEDLMRPSTSRLVA